MLLKLLKKYAKSGKGNLLPGGKGDDKSPSDFPSEEFKMGRKVEMEHTSNPKVAQEIVSDHLTENKHYYSKLKSAGLADELKKGVGRIAPKALEPKFTRPDQEVKVAQAGKDPVKDFKSKKIYKGKITDPMFIPEINAAPNKLKPQAFSIPDQSIIEHEGHHAMVDRLAQKHGVEKISKLYDRLTGMMHPDILHLIHASLHSNDEYRKMAVSPHPRYRLAYKEEMINLLRDFVHDSKDASEPGRRAQLKSMFNRHGHPKFKDFNHMDSALKSSWVKIRDAANKTKPEDLK